MADGIHHLHKRRRVHENLEVYPHPDRWLNLLDRLVFIVALTGVVMTVPQVFEIWVMKNPSGVSLISWSAYTLASAFWVVYGIAHREKTIMVVYSLYTVLNALIVAGILIYG
ncbi:MAG: hypothetical protein U0R44_06020 [Candidatus Micrarchaeia archaeon]